MSVNRIESGFETTMILSDIKVYGVEKQPQLVMINDESDSNFIFDDVYNVSYYLKNNID